MYEIFRRLVIGLGYPYKKEYILPTAARHDKGHETCGGLSNSAII